ncbi:hypothetical protein [Streptomyces sp. RTd22]|uniref:hypothetical protein n=1 Tax=Streptomyces sp. RTd22 TaxID=1841249 RepID=UPI0007C5C96F|nr:hypothetical protein [Streptomyces sp. RTd22]
MPEIAQKLTIKTGKNAGQRPSVTSVYRALAQAEEADDRTGTQVVGPRRLVRAQSTGPGSGTDPELMDRLSQQALGGYSDQVPADLVRQVEDGTNHAVLTDLVRQSESTNGTDAIVLKLLAQARDTSDPQP